MANPYLKAAKIPASTFLEVLFCYANLDSPTMASQVSGISRQSATNIYLRMSNRISRYIPMALWGALFADICKHGLGEIDEKGRLRLINYGDFFHKIFKNLPNQWFKERGKRKLEISPLWEEISLMNDRWKPIPHKYFHQHLSIVLYRLMLRSQIMIIYDKAVDNGIEDKFWLQNKMDWPHVKHDCKLDSFTSMNNMAFFVIEDLKKMLLQEPLSAKDDIQGKLYMEVVKGEQIPLEMQKAFEGNNEVTVLNLGEDF